MARDQSRRGESSHPAQPFEQLYHHHAGLAGYGGSSYIDLVIARDRDTNTGSAGFETREYILQNWRADVVALTAPDGDLLERVTYDAYGIPFATHPADLTTGNTPGVAGYGMPNGVLDANDYNYFLTLYGNTDFRADWNRDGVFDTGDSFAYLADYTAATGSWGRGVLSTRNNILGYAGYVHEPATGSAGGGHGTMYHCRLRIHHAGLGRWIQRDPPQYEYGEGMSLYWYGANAPLVMVDAMGAACSSTGCPVELPTTSPEPPNWVNCDPYCRSLAAAKAAQLGLSIGQECYTEVTDAYYACCVGHSCGAAPGSVGPTTIGRPLAPWEEEECSRRARNASLDCRGSRPPTWVECTLTCLAQRAVTWSLWGCGLWCEGASLIGIFQAMRNCVLGCATTGPLYPACVLSCILKEITLTALPCAACLRSLALTGCLWGCDAPFFTATGARTLNPMSASSARFYF